MPWRSRPVFSVSSSVMPATGSSTRRAPRPDHDHADLEPLLFPVGETARPIVRVLAPVPVVSRVASMRSRCSPLNRAWSVARTPLLTRARASSRFSLTVRLAKMDGVWNFLPTPARRSRSRGVPTRSVLRPKITRPHARLTLPEMTSRSVVLPAPFGPMTTAELLVVHEEVEPVERLEAVVVDGDVFQVDDRPARRRGDGHGATSSRLPSGIAAGCGEATGGAGSAFPWSCRSAP
jgi:hypothetical protein